MDRIRERLRRFTRGRPAPAPSEPSGPQPPPPLPVLPVTRPRPLTATPCAPGATGESRLFQYIPSEIRRSILVAAFGERTLHFDLRLEHPLRAEAPGANGRRGRRQPQHQPQPQPHANAHMFNSYHRDPQRPQEWTWWSSVCHRAQTPAWDFRPIPPAVWSKTDDPANDLCRDSSCHCDAPPVLQCCPGWEVPPRCKVRPETVPPQDCYIGVLPWLLTCRQAYVEGIEVLYATNRLHFAQTHILAHLPRLLVPDRLDMIRHVELLWSLDPTEPQHEYTAVSLTDTGPTPSLVVEERLAGLSRIPLLLPNLCFLHLSFVYSKSPRLPGFMYEWPRQAIYEETEGLLNAVDRLLLRRLPKLRDCRIGLPSSRFYVHKYIFQDGEFVDRNGGSHAGNEAHWRQVDLTPPFTETWAGAQNVLRGYWILRCQ